MPTPAQRRWSTRTSAFRIHDRSWATASGGRSTPAGVGPKGAATTSMSRSSWRSRVVTQPVQPILMGARITQAKVKMGSLRIRCLDSHLDGPAREAPRKIEERSLSTCEVCGGSGERLASDGWVRVRVRCSAHADQ